MPLPDVCCQSRNRGRCGVRASVHHSSRGHSLGLWPGQGRRQLWKLSSQNVLRFFCGLSEAAEDSRCNGCPIKSVSDSDSDSETETLREK